MRALEHWVEAPLATFLAESSARLTLLMTSAGQVVAQHGFTRAFDVMSAAALGAAIMASTDELARLMEVPVFHALSHQGAHHGLFLSGFDTPQGRWIGLVVFGPESSLGLVQLFFQRMVEDLATLAPGPEPSGQVLSEDFEDELNASLRTLFGQ
jgi:hypothetical protein